MVKEPFNSVLIFLPSQPLSQCKIFCSVYVVISTSLTYCL